MSTVEKKKGSMIVEASIVFPVYIIAVVTLCWLVKACFLEAAVFSTVIDQVHHVSVSETGTTGLQSGVKSALEISGIEGSLYSQKSLGGNYTAAGVSGFQRLRYRYTTKIQIPLPFVKKINLDNEILFHPWTGSSGVGAPFSFENMESDGNGVPVVIFPRTGGRYHTTSCRYANAYPTEIVLTEAVRKKYDRCRLCTEGDEADGQKVYVFRYGGSYHESDCSSVRKFTMTMDLEDARKKGYTACSICGGG